MKFAAFDPIELKNKIDPLTVVELLLADISACPDQPRKNFKEEDLQELANSIKTHGVLQPIIVKKLRDNQYQIIAGERRWRASKLAGKATILAIIRPEESQAQENIAVSLIENIQREQLNSIELAYAFSILHKDHNLSHEEIGGLVGKNRATVTNLIRLLTLSKYIQELLINNKMDIGHAKVLMALPAEQQDGFADLIVSKNLSVRSAEKLVQSYKDEPPTASNSYNDMACNWEQRIAERLSTKVRVNITKNGSGKFITYFSSVEEGNRLLDLLLEHVF